MRGWLTLVPRSVQIAILGSILVVGVWFWGHHAGYESGRFDERLAADRAKVDSARRARSTAGAAVSASIAAAAPVIHNAAALHDTVRVVDTATIMITVPGLNSVSTKQNVEIPAVIIRRIIGDSLLLLAKDHIIVAQAAQLKADTTLIDALTGEVKTLSDAKTPVCGGKCRVAVTLAKVVIVAEAAVRVARWLKPR